MLRAAHSLLDALFDLLFPDRCVGCGHLGTLLCPPCRRALIPYTESLPPLPPLSYAHIGYVFDGPLRRLVHLLKYRRERRAAVVLAELMLVRLGHRVAADAVVAVPLHVARRAERGFNQSELIAGVVATRLGLPLLGDELVRTQVTRSQVGLNSRERQHNVAGAFAWKGAAPPPARIIIVDDVLTTGATLRACAEALAAAGARQVGAIAVARSQLAHVAGEPRQ